MILEVVGSDPTPVTLQSAILAFFLFENSWKFLFLLPIHPQEK
jgi:hypothetical protein